MSHAAAHPGDHAHPSHAAGGGGHHHGPDVKKLLAHDNVHAPGFKSGLSIGLMVLGFVGIAAALVAYFTGDEAVRSAALFSYHAGAIIALGLCLGPLGVVLMFHLVDSGWSVTLRRQFENAATLIWAPMILLIPTVIVGGSNLFHWMHPGGDPVIAAKSTYLNPVFFYIRFAVYFAIWGYLAFRMFSLSRLQDQTGDKWLSNKAKFTSAWGMLAFALSVAFAGFDLIKSLDPHWFSTMFGVYFFAGNMIAGLSLMTVLIYLIRSTGKLEGLVTAEHSHDMGKLMLGFTIFWAYIGFSQYFLIWYANIPEETAYMTVRSQGGWETLGKLMMFGHFLGPFIVMLFRDVKRSWLLAVVGVWMIAMHCVDIFWLVRPIPFVNDPADKMHLGLVDLAGVVGPVLLLVGLLLWRVGASPLIPLQDPRLGEAMEHKNYV
ncbi:MAG: hypothetical protein AB7K52_03420 [Phycisphaerales bacterium]